MLSRPAAMEVTVRQNQCSHFGCGIWEKYQQIDDQESTNQVSGVWWGWRKVVSGACMPELSYLLPCMWPLTLKGLLIRRQGGQVMDGGIHFLP